MKTVIAWQGMIPKSGNRFSEKIMPNLKIKPRNAGSLRLNQAAMTGSEGTRAAAVADMAYSGGDVLAETRIAASFRRCMGERHQRRNRSVAI